MKRIVILFAMLCSVIIASAQEYVVVSEKNGNTTVGAIIEDNSEFIRMEKYDDKLIRIIYRSNITSIALAGDEYIKQEVFYKIQDKRRQEQLSKLNAKEKEKPTQKQSVKMQLKEPQKGFQQSVELSLFNYTKKQGFILPSGIDYIAGYRFNDYVYLGGGAGVGLFMMPILPKFEYHNLYMDGADVNVDISLHANFRVYLTKTRVQPFIDLSIGGKFPIPSKRELGFEFYNYNGSIEYSIAGVLLQSGFGVNYRINKKVGVYAKLNYNGSSMRTPVEAYSTKILVKHKMYHGVSLSVGCTF